jgi:hypothetical protein
MPRTIILDQAIITRIEILPGPQQIAVDYSITDQAEKCHQDDRIIYVRTLPIGEDGQPVPNIDKRYVVMTTAQFNYILTLYQAIQAEVTSRI